MSMKVAIICVRNRDGRVGGAERFFDGLHVALGEHGCEATIVSIESDESTFESIEETYLRCYDFDASAFDAVISTKAPSYLVRHPNHVCYLVHTVRVYYDMFEQTFPRPTKQVELQRARIHRLDTLALTLPRTRHVFAIGHEVAARLKAASGISASVLHPPLGFDRFRRGQFGDYIFLPGRLHRWKRVDLAIEALRRSRQPVRLLVAGTGEDEAGLRALAAGVGGVQFLGHVSDEQLVDLYANALAVAFVPIREDYGYVTIEAFRSAKPVVTCLDSGEAAVLVEDGVSGFVVSPDPTAIAGVFDRLALDRGLALRLGESGFARSASLRWDAVVPRLLEALGRDRGTQ
jgi:glycosyltransferase involved in cell wall biosynthesis